MNAVELLILQPTPFCNIDCSYCYLPTRSDKTRMELSTVRKSVERIVEAGLLGPRLSVVWHAGEPLIVPISFYESALEIIHDVVGSKATVTCHFQTNGMLLDDRWAEFIQRHQLNVGVSIDGPEAIHDNHRRQRNGRGTHAAVLQGIRTLQKHNLDFHVISVLTREAMGHPDEMYRFYVDAGIHRVCFNVEEAEGAHASGLMAFDAERSFRRFFRRFLDLVHEGSFPMSIREEAGALWVIENGLMPDFRNHQTVPWALLSVSATGEFCTFSPELLGVSHPEYGMFSLGNIEAISIAQAEELPLFRRMSREIGAGVERCKAACEYFGACGGGAPINKLFENGAFDSDETVFCRLSRKAVLDIVVGFHGDIDFRARAQSRAEEGQ